MEFRRGLRRRDHERAASDVEREEERCYNLSPERMGCCTLGGTGKLALEG